MNLAWSQSTGQPASDPNDRPARSVTVGGVEQKQQQQQQAAQTRSQGGGPAAASSVRPSAQKQPAAAPAATALPITRRKSVPGGHTVYTVAVAPSAPRPQPSEVQPQSQSLVESDPIVKLRARARGGGGAEDGDSTGQLGSADLELLLRAMDTVQDRTGGRAATGPSERDADEDDGFEGDARGEESEEKLDRVAAGLMQKSASAGDESGSSSSSVDSEWQRGEGVWLPGDSLRPAADAVVHPSAAMGAADGGIRSLDSSSRMVAEPWPLLLEQKCELPGQKYGQSGRQQQVAVDVASEPSSMLTAAAADAEADGEDMEGIHTLRESQLHPITLERSVTCSAAGECCHCADDSVMPS